MTRAPAQRLVELSAQALTARLAEALHVYVSAMGYPPGTARQRRNLWLEHLNRPGWRAVGWLDAADSLLGVSLRLRRRARASGGTRRCAAGCATRHGDQRWLEDYFELTELHVRPDAQGHGLGEGLLRALLAGTDRSRVLLSTPEYGDRPPGRAWQLYRRLGFRDVLREHRFTGDFRPFAVLGRELPLPLPRVPD